ncbi:hypothetical protein ACHAPU_009041 [Fusarium lateritium]
MRATFFTLSALPFYAFAQDPAPEAAPTAPQPFIPPPAIDTPTEVPVDLPTSSDAVVIPESTAEAVDVNSESTTQLPAVVEESTAEQAIGQDTTVQLPPLQDIATGLPIVVDSSNFPAPIVDTTTGPVSVVNPTTDTSQPVVQSTTTGEPPVVDTKPIVTDTTTGPPPVVDTTKGTAPVIDTIEPVAQETTTQPLVEGTTTGQRPVIDASTGSAPVIDTTQPILQDDTTQPIVQSTTTEQPIVADTTTIQQPPVQPTTTELEPPSVDTTTWLPVADTSIQPINQTPGSQSPSTGSVEQVTTTEQQPSVDSTTTGVPLMETTTGVLSGETTIGVPSVETTTQQESIQDITTTAAGQPVKTTEESKPSTKDDEPATTEPPTAIAAAAATASVSSVSSQVAVLIPIINKWANDPESLTDETNKEVEDTHDDIVAVIVGLGGKPNVACSKKRGLLGPIGDVINKLACMAEDLTKISSNIVAGNVPAVTSVVSEVQSQNDDLNEEEENKSKETKDSTKQETTNKEESTTEKPTSTEETTTTEATTTATSDMIVCASGSCGGGSCPLGLGSGGSMPKRMQNIPRDIKCEDIPTTTIDGPLPTGPITLDDSKRDRGLEARAFIDFDTTPNPVYITYVSMNPGTTWDDQNGLTTGHFVGAPLDGGWSAAGVNGIYGCTAVLIVTNVGAYTSHIWEVPGFLDVDLNPTSDDFFETNIFNVLRDGTLDATTSTGISTLIGTDSAPGPLHSQFEPHVFIVTPVNTDQSLENPSSFRYQARANQLSTQVTGMIPGAVAGGIHGYFPINMEFSTEMGFIGRTLIEFDMLDAYIVSEQDPTKLQAQGRWRFWVEDKLVTSHSFNIYDEFFDYEGAQAGTPSIGNQKRAEDDAVHKCLVRGDSTATTSAGLSSTDESTTSVASSTDETTTGASSTEKATTTSDLISTTETSADSTNNGETTGIFGTTTTEDNTAEATNTRSDTSLPTSTPSTLITTTRASSDAPTSSATSDASTSSEEARTYYPCVIHAGPRVSNPYCQCSTTVSGEQFVATASLIDNSCANYTSFPSPVIPVTDAPLTQAPVETPFTTTKQGTVLVYSAYTLNYFHLDSFQVTATVGYGAPSTVSTPLPSQTAVDNDGGGQCGTSDSLSKQGFGDACDRAINRFDDDTVYTGYTSRYSRLTKGILMAASVGQAACIAKFECDDYGIGMKGSDIINAREKAKEDDGIWICGYIRLSNSCSIVMDYCTNCKSTG